MFQLFEYLLDRLSMAELELFLVQAWIIWNQRNIVIHGGKLKEPSCEGVNVIFDSILCFSIFFFFINLFTFFFSSPLSCHVLCQGKDWIQCSIALDPSGWCYIICCIIYIYVWMIIQSCETTWIYSSCRTYKGLVIHVNSTKSNKMKILYLFDKSI